MDMPLWIAVGLGAGWVVSKLMLSSGRRLILGTAAGAIGAVVGGLGMRVLDVAPRGDSLSAALAGLAGALWLAGIACVATFGRRPRGGNDARRGGAADSGTRGDIVISRRRGDTGTSVPRRCRARFSRTNSNHLTRR
jgi:uncharacterized membrane protein YeaQ/YmgE (transglycosylase-associated protein family)